MSIVERNRKWVNGNVFNNLERLDASFSDMSEKNLRSPTNSVEVEKFWSHLIHSVVRKNEKTLTERYFVKITLS